MEDAPASDVGGWYCSVRSTAFAADRNSQAKLSVRMVWFKSAYSMLLASEVRSVGNMRLTTQVVVAMMWTDQTDKKKGMSSNRCSHVPCAFRTTLTVTRAALVKARGNVCIELPSQSRGKSVEGSRVGGRLERIPDLGYYKLVVRYLSLREHEMGRSMSDGLTMRSIKVSCMLSTGETMG